MDIAIDLGTSNTRIYLANKGKFLDEPSVVTINLDNDDIISAVEQTPTYKRTREILESIGQPVERVDKTRPAEQQAADMQQGVISFV